MKRRVSRAHAFIVLRAILATAGIFMLGTGLLKLQDTQSFATIVGEHGLIPETLVGPLANILIGLEVLVGTFAIWGAMGSGKRAAFGAAALTTIMLGFTVYAGILALFPPPAPVSCGCAGTSAPVESWTPIMTRNARLAIGGSIMTLVLSRIPAIEPKDRTSAITVPA